MLPGRKDGRMDGGREGWREGGMEGGREMEGRMVRAVLFYITTVNQQ